MTVETELAELRESKTQLLLQCGRLFKDNPTGPLTISVYDVIAAFGGHYSDANYLRWLAAVSDGKPIEERLSHAETGKMIDLMRNPGGLWRSSGQPKQVEP